MHTKYIVVTGGVLSGLGKGVVSASIARLLDESLRKVMIKCDGYLNVDPGTMNPLEHGEVFVLEDGTEVDLDFGHYERFAQIKATGNCSITSGKVFLSLVEQERRGDFLGKTVQVIPHVTGEIRRRIDELSANADVVLIEIGGTVGDIENVWFLEAARELIREKGKQNVYFVHLGLIPTIEGQQKTKPLQQSVSLLRQHGIFPDIIVGRSQDLLEPKTRQKIEWLCNVTSKAIMSDPTLETMYELPLIFEKEGMLEFLAQADFPVAQKLDDWKVLVANLKNAREEKTIAICGKYTEVCDSYLSVVEALKHAAAHCGVQIRVTYVDTTTPVRSQLANVDGIIVPGGFGARGIQGKLDAIEFARTNAIPYLGLCYGLQLAVVEFARHVCDLDANTTEIDPNTPNPIITILPGQEKKQKGASMRLGAYKAQLMPGSQVATLYQQVRNQTYAIERHRHRYEVNPMYHQVLTSNGLRLSGMYETLVEFIELPAHPFFVATQSHPELSSTLENPSPLFVGFIQATRSV
jgi:CTP synthase